jgi:predicted O-methyltransferase YrrM
VTGVSRPGAPRPVTPVSILAAELEQLADALDAVPGPDEGWRERLRGACALAAGLDPYVSRCTSPESPALRGLAEATAAEDWRRHGDGPAPAPLEQEMLSGHVEGRLLGMLVHVTRARRVLDIGMFTGYSALAMAEALPADATVVACEIDPDVAAFARERFAASADGHKIDVRVGPAERTLAELAADAPFDLVFLDADKAGYVAYFTALLDTGLLAPHGLLCVDNTLMQGQPYLPGSPTANGKAVAEFNDVVAADPRVEQVLLPVRDGLTLIRRVGAP